MWLSVFGGRLIFFFFFFFWGGCLDPIRHMLSPLISWIV
jgi:hypothetical protein